MKWHLYDQKLVSQLYPLEIPSDLERTVKKMLHNFHLLSLTTAKFQVHTLHDIIKCMQMHHWYLLELKTSALMAYSLGCFFYCLQ